jgi:hypothetical protein
MKRAVGLEVVEGSDLKYADIYGEVAQSFRARQLIPVIFTINGICGHHS